MNNLARNVIIWLIFGAALIGLFNLFQGPSSGQPANELAYSDFVAEVEAQLAHSELDALGRRDHVLLVAVT